MSEGNPSIRRYEQPAFMSVEREKLQAYYWSRLPLALHTQDRYALVQALVDAESEMRLQFNWVPPESSKNRAETP